MTAAGDCRRLRRLSRPDRWRAAVARAERAASVGEPGPPETAASHHQRGVDFHLQRRLDEAAREYAQALALDPPRAPGADERATILRFAPRVYTTPDEIFPLKDAAAVLHPSERLIAYHLFWEDDIDFPDDNDPCDHEVVWVQFSPDRRSIERFWTYFHGRILEAGEDALRDARDHGMRPRVNVQWGKHGSMPLAWESMAIVGDAGDLERAYYTVGKAHPLADYNRGTWQKLRKEGRRLDRSSARAPPGLARSLHRRLGALRRFLARGRLAELRSMRKA